MKNFCSPISELTEKSENGPDIAGVPGPSGLLGDTPTLRSWILYDGDCRFCISSVNRFQAMFATRGFAFLPLQTPWVQQRLGLLPGAPLEEMRVLTTSGEDLGGADAVLFLLRQIRWLRPLALLGKVPLAHSAMVRAYRWVAARRGCSHLSGHTGQCAINLTSPRSDWRGILPLLILSLTTILLRPRVEPWVFMWLMVGSIFLGCKWLTLERAKQQGGKTTFGRQFAYLFLWPGLDARSFLGPRRRTTRGFYVATMAGAVSKIALGAFLLWGIVRHVTDDLLAGWIGMIGMILILHFGVFDLAAGLWQSVGIPARPIMNAPWRSARVSEFWGRRWNHAFQQLVIDNLFRPLAGSLGVVRATLITFFISGLLHELVISLPAGAGYGLPTGYFLLQGWAVIAQRTPLFGRVRLSRGVAGRLFTLLVIAVPAFGLFHPPFVRGVILPFMRVIHAL